MSTREAFRLLVENPYLWSKTGAAMASRHVYKHRIAKDQWPTIDAMERLLDAAFEVKQEKLWQLKS